jgi:A/G-specific adenine glycosylase
MLQQTRVSAVVPYFQRFMASFPSLEALARAPVEEVLRHWAGLGYYARARNLHRAAVVLRQRHGGQWPADPGVLTSLPGIGRSTAGAILSLGLGLRAPILDGNVKRVLCRWAGIEAWPGAARVARELWALSETLTPSERVADYNQAMMDLGATLCTRHRPACAECPLKSGCRACRDDLTDVIPAPKPRRDLPTKRRLVLILRNGVGQVLLQRRPPAGLWGGLWSLPEFSDEAELGAWLQRLGITGVLLESPPPKTPLRSVFDPSRGKKHLGRPGVFLERRAPRRHTFSHFHLDYTPVIVVAEPARISECGSGGWHDPRADLAVPAPVRRLLDELAGSMS